MRTDWAGLIDAWSVRFFSELDYEKEAATADLFRQQMSKLQGIVVPGVYSDLTTRVVLVTEWVEGELPPAACHSMIWALLFKRRIAQWTFALLDRLVPSCTRRQHNRLCMSLCCRREAQRVKCIGRQGAVQHAAELLPDPGAVVLLLQQCPYSFDSTNSVRYAVLASTSMRARE